MYARVRVATPHVGTLIEKSAAPVKCTNHTRLICGDRRCTLRNSVAGHDASEAPIHDAAVQDNTTSRMQFNAFRDERRYQQRSDPWETTIRAFSVFVTCRRKYKGNTERKIKTSPLYSSFVFLRDYVFF